MKTKKKIDADEAEQIYQDAELDFKNLRADLKAAAAMMSKDDVRFFVNDYYSIQKSRVRHDNQCDAAKANGQPTQFLDWMAKKWRAFESTTKAALQAYAESKPNTKWVMSLVGGGPVIAAGLDAHIDINMAKTAGAIWRFAGLDSSLEWLNEKKSNVILDEMLGENDKLDREMLYMIAGRLKRRGDTFETLAKAYGWDGQGNIKRTIAKKILLTRPYNAKLKTICWKLAQCFVYTCNHEDSFYGKLYLERKPKEIEANLSGQYSDQAQKVLQEKAIGKDTDAYLWYSGCLTREAAEKIVYASGNKQALLKSLAGQPGSGLPMLPPAHIQARTARWVIKIFLSHYFDVTYRVTFKKEPPKPYIIEHGGHVHMIDVPNLDVIENFGK